VGESPWGFESLRPHMSSPRDVVVTGGAGLIGSHLFDALIARGHVVTCVDNLAGTGGSTRNVAHLSAHPRFPLQVDNSALSRLGLDWWMLVPDVVDELAGRQAA
jgi:nucleoside-diphosphate-sugar epimerase